MESGVMAIIGCVGNGVDGGVGVVRAVWVKVGGGSVAVGKAVWVSAIPVRAIAMAVLCTFVIPAACELFPQAVSRNRKTIQK